MFDAGVMSTRRLRGIRVWPADPQDTACEDVRSSPAVGMMMMRVGSVLLVTEKGSGFWGRDTTAPPRAAEAGITGGYPSPSVRAGCGAGSRLGHVPRSRGGGVPTLSMLAGWARRPEPAPRTEMLR